MSRREELRISADRKLIIRYHKDFVDVRETGIDSIKGTEIIRFQRHPPTKSQILRILGYSRW